MLPQLGKRRAQERGAGKVGDSCCFEKADASEFPYRRVSRHEAREADGGDDGGVHQRRSPPPGTEPPAAAPLTAAAAGAQDPDIAEQGDADAGAAGADKPAVASGRKACPGWEERGRSRRCPACGLKPRGVMWEHVQSERHLAAVRKGLADLGMSDELLDCMFLDQ